MIINNHFSLKSCCFFRSFLLFISLFSIFSFEVCAQNNVEVVFSKASQKNSVQSNFVIAKVNKRVITLFDLKDRYNFIILESKIKLNSPQEKNLLINQIIDKMIDEELIRQEGEKLSINVSEAEMDGVLESIAARQNKSVSGLKKSFAAKNLSFAAYQNQIKSDLIWSQIVSSSAKSRIKISDAQIREFLEQQKLNTDVTKFLIAEIFIPKDHDSKLLAEKLAVELRHGADFQTIVSQFSRSPAAESGGELGWIAKGEVDNKIYNAISALEKNQYCDPVFLNEGYYIFKVLDKKSVVELKENDAAEARKKIFMREIDIESKSYLIDLHKSAFIEVNRKELSKFLVK